MKKLLAEIQSGQFAKEWIDENKTGRRRFLGMREAGARPSYRTRRRRAQQNDDIPEKEKGGRGSGSVINQKNLATNAK